MSDDGLSPAMMSYLSRYPQPTPVQAQAIPTILSRRSTFICAATGSGKTFAYLAPVLSLLSEPRAGYPRALILTANRDLALQVVASVRDVATATSIPWTCVPFRASESHVASAAQQGPQKRSRSGKSSQAAEATPPAPVDPNRGHGDVAVGSVTQVATAWGGWSDWMKDIELVVVDEADVVVAGPGLARAATVVGRIATARAATRAAPRRGGAATPAGTIAAAISRVETARGGAVPAARPVQVVACSATASDRTVTATELLIVAAEAGAAAAAAANPLPHRDLAQATATSAGAGVTGDPSKDEDDHPQPTAQPIQGPQGAQGPRGKGGKQGKQGKQSKPGKKAVQGKLGTDAPADGADAPAPAEPVASAPPLNAGLCVAAFSAAALSETDTVAARRLRAAVAARLVRIYAGSDGAVAAGHVAQELVYTGAQESSKVLLLKDILARGVLPPALVFVQTAARAETLVAAIKSACDAIGMQVAAIHPALPPHRREALLLAIRTGALHVAVTTDALARGFDAPLVGTVINFDFPTSAAVYVHRIGRTGRAGRAGRAITLWTDDDVGLLGPIAAAVKRSVEVGTSATAATAVAAAALRGRREADDSPADAAAAAPPALPPAAAAAAHALQSAAAAAKNLDSWMLDLPRTTRSIRAAAAAGPTANRRAPFAAAAEKDVAERLGRRLQRSKKLVAIRSRTPR